MPVQARANGSRRGEVGRPLVVRGEARGIGASSFESDDNHSNFDTTRIQPKSPGIHRGRPAPRRGRAPRSNLMSGRAGLGLNSFARPSGGGRHTRLHKTQAPLKFRVWVSRPLERPTGTTSSRSRPPRRGSSQQSRRPRPGTRRSCSPTMYGKGAWSGCGAESIGSCTSPPVSFRAAPPASFARAAARRRPRPPGGHQRRAGRGRGRPNILRRAEPITRNNRTAAASNTRSSSGSALRRPRAYSPQPLGLKWRRSHAAATPSRSGRQDPRRKPVLPTGLALHPVRDR